MAQFNKITIIGVGLIGGSLAKAIKEKKVAKEIVGYFRNKTRLKKALKAKLVDKGFLNLEDSIKDSDLIILGLPINLILNFMAKIKEIKNNKAIVIDVGSTKSTVVATADRLKLNFVGTHPLAGSEKRGMEFCVEDLFNDSLVILTPSGKTNRAALKKIANLWKCLKAKTVVLSPRQHDKILASTSHLPHATAFCLMNSIPQAHLAFGASGLKDSTRIALSDAQIWSDIFLSNKKEVLNSVRSLENQIKKFKQVINKNNAGQLLKFINLSQENRSRIE